MTKYRGRLGGAIFGSVLSCMTCPAATLFVSTNGTHHIPFDTWQRAATNIQSAVNYASEGDVVVVSNGVYMLASTVTITNGITVRSLNGPQVTVVDGNLACQCFYIDRPNSVLDGFTITGGWATEPGTGGGGVALGDGTLRNCIISNNFSWGPGAGYGGGVACYAFGTPSIENCIIVGNRSYSNGGGVFGPYCGPSFRNVVVANNISGFNGGGFWFFSEGTTAESLRPALENVTICGNIASNGGGGIALIGYCRVSLTNCILWGDSSPEIYRSAGQTTVSHSDVQGGCSGENIITNNPMFVGPNDWHLRASSPCIDAGTNLMSLAGDTDIDGQPRLFNDRVDMGADEAVIRAVGVSVSNGVQTVWDTVMDAQCKLQCCTNLALTNWYPAGDFITCTQSTVTICDTQTECPTKFYRLQWHRP